MKSLLNRLEERPRSLIVWVLAALAIMLFRAWLEGFSSPATSANLDIDDLAHHCLYFFSLTLALILIVHLLSGKSIAAVSRLTVWFLFVICLAPLADLFWEGRYAMAYLMIGDAKGWFMAFLTYFGPQVEVGISPGMKVEVGAAIAGLAGYVWYCSRDILKAAAAAVLSYAVIFLWLSVPTLLWFAFSPFEVYSLDLFFSRAGLDSALAGNLLLENLSGIGQMVERIANMIISQIFYILLAAVSALWYYFYDADKFRAIWRNSRFLRVGHYYLILSLGLLCAASVSPAWPALSWVDICSLVVMYLSLYFAWMFAVGFNDLADIKIDKVSNQDRPLISGVVSRAEMATLNIYFLLMFLIGAALLGPYVFAMISVFSLCYFIYSVPYIRLKKIPFISAFLVALAGGAAFLSGYFYLAADKSFDAVPLHILGYLISGLVIFANIKDYKDVEGDKEDNVKTLPVIFGAETSKKVLEALALIWLIAVVWRYPVFLLTIIPTAFFFHKFLNKRPFKENHIFLLYFAFVAASALLVLL